MVQYNDFSTIPQTIRDIVANRCRLLDQYVLFQTGDLEYTALIRDPISGEVTQLLFTRLSNYGIYDVVESEGDWQYTIINEYYCYSNVGVGSALDLPVMEGVQAHAAVTLTVCLMFLVVFRGILFPFQRRKK